MAALATTLESLLVVCPSWVGDTVMATPVLRAVRTAQPGARIIGAMRPGLEELLAGSGWLDEIVAAETKTLAGPWRMARRVRRIAGRPGAALVLPNSFRAALLGRLAGSRQTIGYDRNCRGPLLTHTLAWEPALGPVPAVDYYAKLAEWALGSQLADRRLKLAVTETQQAAATRLLEGVKGPFVVLNPGANRPDKRWPPSRFAAVAEALAKTYGLEAVLTGSTSERGIVEAVVSRADGPIHNLLSRGISLGSLKAVIQRADLLITNDTGPRHIAAALGTPIVTLFGPTDHRWTTIDYPRERILLAEPFLTSDLVADENPARCSIDRIAVGDVLRAADQLLTATPRRPSTSLQ